MVTKKPKGLGRGLEALLGPKTDDASAPATAAQGLPSTLTLDELVPGMYQPRTRMDEGALYELAESIKAQGINGDDIESIVVSGSEKMCSHHDISEPQDMTTAQYSAPFSVALAFYRDPRDPGVFNDAALNDPAIRALTRKVRLEVRARQDGDRSQNRRGESRLGPTGRQCRFDQGSHLVPHQLTAAGQPLFDGVGRDLQRLGHPLEQAESFLAQV